MKAEELRIGNVVRCDGVYGYLLNDAFPITANGLKQFSDGILSFDPVPLTEEWLNRIDWRGYKDLYFNSYFCLDGSCHLYYRGDYTGINVNYVHQLQNLYWCLTGEELKLQ